MTVQEIVSTIGKRWKLLAATVALAAVLMGAYQYTALSDQYTSSTTLYLVNSASQGAGISSADIAVSEKLLADYQEVLISRRVLAAASEEVGREIDPKAVRANLVNGTHVIRLSVSSVSPESAAYMTNVITKHFVSVVTEIFSVESVSVIDTALPPRLPSGPRRARNVLLAAGLTLLLGVAGSVMWALWDTTLHNRDELESKVGLPVLAIVPRFRPQKRAGMVFEEALDDEYL